MSRIVRTARGVEVDFDAIIIKQQLAQAPMNVEVARRKEFIDSKEGKGRGAKPVTIAPVNYNASNEPTRVIDPSSSQGSLSDPFEIVDAPLIIQQPA